MFNSLQIIATIFAMLGETSKIKRTLSAIRADWNAGRPRLARLLVQLMLLLMALGGPAHYAFAVAQELAHYA